MKTTLIEKLKICKWKDLVDNGISGEISMIIEIDIECQTEIVGIYISSLSRSRVSG